MKTAQTILLCAALSAAVFLGLAVGRYACDYNQRISATRIDVVLPPGYCTDGSGVIWPARHAAPGEPMCHAEDRPK